MITIIPPPPPHRPREYIIKDGKRYELADDCDLSARAVGAIVLGVLAYLGYCGLVVDSLGPFSHWGLPLVFLPWLLGALWLVIWGDK